MLYLFRFYPTNGNIKISEDTIKYPLSINIEKIKNKETFEIESESESEPENSPPPSSSSPKKRKSAPESAPTLNNENLLQNDETRIVPSKRKSAPEPASDVNENLLKNRETRTVPSKRKSAPEPASDVNENLLKNRETHNRAIILKIYEKLNKLETDFADMKKGQSGMETDIKKIKNEICLLTNDNRHRTFLLNCCIIGKCPVTDKEFMEDIIVSAAEVILKLNLYPSPQEYKESCEAYIQQFHEDIYNSGMETDIKKIKNEICLLTNDKEFMEDIIVSAAEVILKLNLYPSPQEYKESCEAYIQQFHEDIYNSFGRKWNVYYESKIQSKLSDKIRSQRGTLCGKIRTAMYDVFGNQLRPIKSNAKSQEILNWKQLPSTKSNPKKSMVPTSKPPEQHVAWAISIVQTILDPTNGNIKISEDTIKYPLSINIEKIKNKETFEIESESESEPENSPPPSSSSPKKRKSAPESAPTLNNENLLQNDETRIVPSKRKSAPEPASDVNENLLKNRETRTVPSKRKSAPEPASDARPC
ncbi:hypothetical protein Glove_9g355 [Diversispora epigaea]|uniref:Uncharacterized protein n=1 Tax=Diversispora epigaea TaxID=1348612 RepID=A0A397JQQ7_9GLOM|nr:hypothetical protein Glove_9g355 [Diversispora epigaea]